MIRLFQALAAVAALTTLAACQGAQYSPLAPHGAAGPMASAAPNDTGGPGGGPFPG